MPEPFLSTSVVRSSLERRLPRFPTVAVPGALRFALTAGECGLTQRDRVAYAQSLCAVELDKSEGHGSREFMSSEVPSAHGFLRAVRHKQNRMLAK